MSVRLRKWKNKEGTVEERWIVDVQVDLPGEGIKRVRDFSPINTRRGAEQHERQIRQALQDRTFGKEPSTKEVPTLANFEAQYLEYAELHNKLGTVQEKRSVLKNHLIPAFSDCPSTRSMQWQWIR